MIGRSGQPKKVMSPGAPGGVGEGAEQYEYYIRRKCFGLISMYIDKVSKVYHYYYLNIANELTISPGHEI